VIILLENLPVEGAIFRRNDYERGRDTPKYYLVITLIRDGIIYYRRLSVNGRIPLIHESGTYHLESLIRYFTWVK